MGGKRRGFLPGRTRWPALPAAALLGLMAIAALFPGLITRQDPLSQNVAERLAPPGPEHLFGTDGFGRDVFSRVVHGTRASVLVGILAVSFASVIGVTVGLASGYAGGKVDLVLQRGVDVFLGFPFLALALVIIVALRPSALSVALAIGVAQAPLVARVARAAAMAIRTEDYILAARSGGAGPVRIVFRHVLPNSLSPILAQVTGYLGAAMAAEATLSFLGLGTPPPFPSWGGMLQEGARQYLETGPWIAAFPGLALSLAVMSFALLGDAVRDALEVRRPPGVPRRSRNRSAPGERPPGPLAPP